MLDQTAVSNAYRAVFRADATQSQADFYANNYNSLDDAIDAMILAAPGTARAVTYFQVFYDRLPAAGGLDFWTNVVNSSSDYADTPDGNVALANEFFTAGEFDTIYGGLATAQAVTLMFNNILNRPPAQAGLTFWVDAIDNGGLTLADMGREFAIAPETRTTYGPLIDSYLTLDAKGEPIPGTSIFDLESTAGSTFALTTNADDLTGTDLDDTFTGTFDGSASSTATLGDMLDGGAGTDSFNLTSDFNGSFPAVDFTSVENFFFRETGSGNTLTVDFNGIPGEQQAWSDRSAGNLDFEDLGTGAAVGLKGDGATEMGAVFADYSDPMDDVNIVLSGGAIQTFGGTGLFFSFSTGTDATITSSSGDNMIGGIDLGSDKTSVTVNAASDVTIDNGSNFGSASIFGFDNSDPVMVSVTGTGMVDLARLDNTVDMVDGSGSTGGLTAHILSQTVEITGTGGDDILGSATALTSGSFDGGAGTDRMVVWNNGVVSSSTDGAKYTNFEAAQAQNSVQLDFDFLSGIQSAFINDFGSNTALIDLTAQQAQNVTALNLEGSFQITLKGAAQAGQVDTLTITADNENGTDMEDAAFSSTPNIQFVENVNLISVDEISINSLSNTGSGNSDIQNLTVSGIADVEIFTGGKNFDANTVVDGSGMTAKFEFDASSTNGGNSLSITGGSADDELSGTNVNSATGDVIDGGGGADMILGGRGNDVMSGGSGADIFMFQFGDTFSVPSDTLFDIITDFEAGVDEIDAFNNLFVFQATANPAPGTAQVNAEGVAFFNADDDTLNERIFAVENAIGNNSNAFAVFEHGSDSYLFIADGDGFLDSDDVLVQLAGVTGLTSSDITNGDLFLA